MKEIDLIQGSAEWLEWRKGKISSSTIAAIMGVCPFKSKLDAYYEILGKKTQFVTPAMQRGKDLEPQALSKSQEIMKLLFRPACFEANNPLFIASLDGIDLDEKRILELKIVGDNSFQRIKNEGIPIHYNYQMQWQMLVTEKETCTLVVWDKDLSNWLIFVLYSNPKVQSSLTESALDFLEDIKNEVPPLGGSDEPVLVEDKEFNALEREYKDISDTIHHMTERRDGIKRKILDEFFDDTAVRGEFIVIQNKVKQGSIDAKKMEQDGIEVSKYRKPSITYPEIRIL